MGKARGLLAAAATFALLVMAGCGTAETPASGGGGVAGTPVRAELTPTPPPSTGASPGATGPTATPGVGTPTVTLTADGQTIELAVGQRFLLRLGIAFDWTVNVADTAVLSRVPNVLVVRGAQGIYVAKAPGETTLTATGDPPCRQATPPCAAPSRLFHVRIIVRPAGATATP